jgi:hypothetical protein
MYLKPLVISLFTILSLVGYSQDNNIELSLDYSYGLSFRRFDSDNSMTSSINKETPTGVHGINVQIKYILNEQFGIVSGLGYNQYGEELTYGFTFGTIDPNYGYIADTSSSSINVKYIYEFLSLPILINYSILNREKSSVNFQLGGTLNYLIRSHYTSNIEYKNGDKEKKTYNYEFDSNNLNFAGQIGVYYKRNLGEKYFFWLGPQMNYFFSSIIDSDLVAQRPYKVSINLGIGF